jgi:hypothetical protein
MAQARIHIIEALRNTATTLESSTQYQWGHMGACNCGFLAQEVTKLRKDEIHSRAMEKHGDWNEQLNDYCPTSGFRIDDLISEMLAFGFDADDLKHLEKLSDPKILRALPVLERNLKNNIKSDVVKYLNVWTRQLEEEILTRISINEIKTEAFTLMEG